MRIKANGIQINYELSGRMDGPVAILSHSLGSSLMMWEPQMDSLEPHFKLLRYDIRGYGGTEVPVGPYTLNMLGDDAIALLDGLGMDQAHWVGLSMGGMIGQCVALNHPDRIRSLALCDTGATVPKEAQPVWEERISTARKEGLAALLQPTMERWFTAAFLRQNSQRLVLIRREFLATSLEGYIGCSEAIRKLNYLERLGEIRIPSLIIAGEDDPGMPLTAAKAMHERIKDSKLVVLRSAAHLSNMEQPEAFNAALLSFLRGI